MSIRRPVLNSTTCNPVSVDLPKGWLATVSGISRQTYNQLVVVDYPFLGKTRQSLLANVGDSPNTALADVDTGSGQILIIPQEDSPDDAVRINFRFFYSDLSLVTKANLDDPRYAGGRLGTFVSNKPDDAPNGIPDYMSIHIFAEDRSDAIKAPGEPQYDDLVLTVHMISQVKPLKLDTIPIFPETTGERALKESSARAVHEFLQRNGGKSNAPLRPPPYRPTPELAALPVGIIGAGVAGVYIGMMLDSLGIKVKTHPSAERYEIMEGSARVGGRLYTHNFPKNQGKYQYYDVGAMRYSNTTFMKRTFDLVQNHLKMPNAFIKYIRTNEKTFLCYNDITVTREQNEASKPIDDVFRVSTANGGNVPQGYVARGTSALWDDALKELRDNFKNLPFKEAYDKLMVYEGYSVSGYLQHVMQYPIDVIDWFQSVESRTGLFDEALSETVLASLVFNDPNFEGKEIDWYCLDGGSEIVHKAMTEKLSSKPQVYHRATVIEESDGGNSITVTFDARQNPNPSAQVVTQRKYSNVISTMSFGCLRMVNLRKAGLNYGQKQALKDLMYTPSVKVGMQFKSAWWERLGIVGGQSSTDLPIRDCVYPSYGPDDSHTPKGERSNCMIVVYNGMQDSQRIAGLIHGKDSAEERAMLDLIMRDLAQLHNVDVQMLWDEFEDHHAWDFHHDPFQLGAFGQFGPGQFKTLYPYMHQPAGSKQRLHFAGDLTSRFHGWVAGALASGWRAVMGMLVVHPELNPNPNEDIIAKFKKMWGESEELEEQHLIDLVKVGHVANGADGK